MRDGTQGLRYRTDSGRHNIYFVLRVLKLRIKGGKFKGPVPDQPRLYVKNDGLRRQMGGELTDDRHEVRLFSKATAAENAAKRIGLDPSEAAQAVRAGETGEFQHYEISRMGFEA